MVKMLVMRGCCSEYGILEMILHHCPLVLKFGLKKKKTFIYNINVESDFGIDKSSL